MTSADPTNASPDIIEQTIRDRRFSMVFQPIVDLQKRRVFAYEALCRPQLYPSPPALIADAARHGRLGLLGRILREAASAGCPDAPLFMNIHPDELLEHFLVQPDDPVFTHGEVYLELTEVVPLSRLDLVGQMLSELQARGVYVVVDDLGSGYSNLRYLADLTPRVVKLDKVLVTSLQPDTRQFKLVKGIVAMCRDLGARVIAECIETAEELDASMHAGCDFGQGYVLARPAVPAPEFAWPG